MLFEATMAMLAIMFLTWAGAIWASYREEEGIPTTHSLSHREEKKAA